MSRRRVGKGRPIGQTDPPQNTVVGNNTEGAAVEGGGVHATRERCKGDKEGTVQKTGTAGPRKTTPKSQKGNTITPEVLAQRTVGLVLERLQGKFQKALCLYTDQAIEDCAAIEREERAKERQAVADAIAPLQRQIDELAGKVASVTGLLLRDHRERNEQITRVRVLRNEVIKASQDVARGHHDV